MGDTCTQLHEVVSQGAPTRGEGMSTLKDWGEHPAPRHEVEPLVTITPVQRK